MITLGDTGGQLNIYIYIFDIHSHQVITIWNMMEITITKAIMKHIEYIATHDKVTFATIKERIGSHI